MHHSAPFFAAAGHGPAEVTHNPDPQPLGNWPAGIADRAEQFLQAEGRGLNPHYRITQGDIEDAIASQHYFTGMEGAVASDFGYRGDKPEALDRITFCVLVLKSGVSVVGIEHAQEGVALDEAVGRQGALADALRQVWPLVIHERKARVARGE